MDEYQMTIQGTLESPRNITQEVSSILKTFPAARTNKHLFGRIFLKRRIAWFSLLDDNQQIQLVDTVHDLLTADRTLRKENELERESKI